MFLQKLAYIANGWNLLINEHRLIYETAQAWDNGPVYFALWRHVKDWGYGGDHYMLTKPFGGEPIKADLLPEEKDVIDHVWKRYGKYNAATLSKMTHQPGTPWAKAYLERGRNAELYDRDIVDHFKQLALAGRKREAGVA
ncbi:MAG: SocA family protein [Rhodobacteraceae bacterium]|nr:SocA family protein [Paracoccaceae bacterium]